jgi:hypothetical protein
MSNFGLENFFSYHYYLYQRTFEIIFFYFANLGGPLKLGARGKFPPLPPPLKGPAHFHLLFTYALAGHYTTHV